MEMMCESSVATTAELSASGSSHKSLTNRNCLQRLFDFLFHHLTMGNCGGKTKKGPPDADGDNSKGEKDSTKALRKRNAILEGGRAPGASQQSSNAEDQSHGNSDDGVLAAAVGLLPGPSAAGVPAKVTVTPTPPAHAMLPTDFESLKKMFPKSLKKMIVNDSEAGEKMGNFVADLKEHAAKKPSAKGKGRRSQFPKDPPGHGKKNGGGEKPGDGRDPSGGTLL